MTYNQALAIMHAAVERGYSRQRLEQIWERITRAARERHDTILYAHCPICESWLDWAWCYNCKTNR